MSVETGLTMVPAITSHGSSHAPNPTVGSKRKRGSPDGDGSHLERQATENHLSKRQSLGTSASRSGAFADPSPDDFSSHQPRDLFPPSDNQDSFLGSHVLSDSMPNYFNPEYANGGHDRMPMATAPHAPMTGAPNSASIPSPTSHSPYPGMNEVARLQGFNPSDRPLASNQFSDHQGELSTDFPVLDPGSLEKPSPGSSEWHRLRKDNHKEVERRRRENINEGINELAKIVPGCEKNKGSILSNTATFIQHLKDKEMQNLHAWSLEKTLSAQAINSLTVQVNNLDHELEVMTRERDIALQQLEHANREIERWKKACLETNDSPADGVAADLQTDDNGGFDGTKLYGS